jgi:multiple sugar transport system ATP-binding protein
MASLELQGVVKRFGAVEVIHGVDLKVEDGEFVVFVGPSGCGKSTLLRMIAGLEEITDGEVYIDGRQVNGVGAAKRGLAMVFQSYALYPHMSVRKNLSFGLETMGAPKAEIKKRVAQAAEILQIGQLLDRRPGQLSGGQRQRVAIGRAIVREPKIFLFDEPLSNLDAELRVQMRVEINKLHRRLGATMIFVTHDQVEAMTLADRIVVLRAGVIEQVGTPLDLYNHPANLFVAGFIGSPRMNFLAAEVAGQEEGSIAISGKSGFRLTIPVQGELPGAGASVTVGIRPEHLHITDSTRSMLAGEVQIAEHLGGETFLYVALPSGEVVVAEVQGQIAARSGERVGIDFDMSFCHVFAADGKVLDRASSGRKHSADDRAVNGGRIDSSTAVPAVDR